MDVNARTSLQPLEPPFVAFLALAVAASLIPIWCISYLPMADLPQHAAQISIWKHIDDPAYPEMAETYRIRYFIPYFFGYLLTRLVASVMPVALAVKVVVSLAIAAYPVSLALLLRRCGADVWWSLFGAPLAFGFAFYWGFLNYLISVPLGLAYLTLGIGYAREPGLRRALWMTGFGIVLYFSHALVLGLVVPLAALLVFLLAGRDRWSLRGLARLLPFVPPPIAVLIWASTVRQGQGRVVELWLKTTWERLDSLPSVLVGTESGDWKLAGFLILLLPVLFGKLRLRQAWLVLPMTTAFALYLAFPNRGLGAWHLNQRFAVFIGAFLPLLVAPAVSAWRRRLGRGLLVAFVLAYPGWLLWSFQGVDQQHRDLAKVLDAIPAHASLLGLVFDPGFGVLQGAPVYYHSHLWHQVERGGIVEHSFASSYPSVARYKKGVWPHSRRILNQRPNLFNPRIDGPFDYYLIRVDQDLSGPLFRKYNFPVELAAHEGMWWLYRRLPLSPTLGNG